MSYNGHKNRNHWNVALLIGNTEGLYRQALMLMRECASMDRAVECMMSELHAAWGEVGKDLHTPDGVRVSKTAVRAAMRGLRD